MDKSQWNPEKFYAQQKPLIEYMATLGFTPNDPMLYKQHKGAKACYDTETKSGYAYQDEQGRSLSSVLTLLTAMVNEDKAWVNQDAIATAAPPPDTSTLLLQDLYGTCQPTEVLHLPQMVKEGLFLTRETPDQKTEFSLSQNGMFFLGKSMGIKTPTRDLH